MNSKFKNLCVRTASGVVLLLLVVGALMWTKWSTAALFAVIMVGGLIEFYRLSRARGYEPLSILGIANAIAIFALAGIVWMLWGSGKPASEVVADTTAILLFYVVLIAPLTFVCELWHKSETPIANIATTLAGVIYVALPISLILFIPQLLVGKWSEWAMMSYIVVIWANDVFAYLVGVAIGKHRLCERLSPKKSWEGFFGGVIGAVGVAVLFGYLFGGNLWVWGGLGLVTALAGVAGDLAESMLKREADVKDSGRMMPGHGGFLDRFDALFISTPFVFVYLCLMSYLM